jgi:glycosyltransferase involved in cell wall biosynthesis
MDPEVAVIIPTHDRWPLLQRALASVSAQTIAAADVIVVDDASTDGTADRLEALGAPRTRVVRLTERSGASHARNVGIDASRSEYVAFLDSDDEWLPNYLETMLGAFAASPATIAVCSGQRVKQSTKPDFVVGPKWGSDGFVSILSGTARISIGIVAKREALGDVRFDETLPAVQDRDLLIRLARKGIVAGSNEPLYIAHRDADVHLSVPLAQIQGRLMLIEKYSADLSERPTALASNYFGLARLYRSVGDRTKTRDFLQRASAADPSDRRLRLLGSVASLGPRAASAGLTSFIRLARWKGSIDRRLRQVTQ